MIVFEKIKWKNFLSYGNYWTEVVLPTAPTTLISGKNGCGKSTFLDAITFALFGRAYRFINKPRITNTINDKDCMVELTFTIGKQSYVIKRGLKPVVFEIYCDGVLINQDAKNLDYQRHLEQNILKLNYDSFSQLIVLGSANYVPFMQLTTSQRRDVIEELLDLKVFTRMNNVLKEKYSFLRDEIKNIDVAIANSKDKCKIHEDHIQRLKSKNTKDKEEKQKQIDEIRKIVSDLQTEQDDLRVKYQVKSDELTAFIDGKDVAASVEKYTKLRMAINTEGKEISKKIDFYNKNDCCPTCKQGIDCDFKNETLSGLSTRLGEATNAITDIDSKLGRYRQKLDQIHKYTTELQTINSDISMLNVRISESNSYISKLQNYVQSSHDDAILVEENNLNTLLNQIQTDSSTKESLVNKKHEYDVIQLLLKDNGIKSKIIKQYLPLMNKYINKYLSAMDFFVNFNLDESFKEKIKSRHRDDFEYNSFSEGEKFRIDMALMLTWREIARAKNSTNTNILILDEVFDSSLDASGTEDFLKLLKHLSANTHVFVISHKGDILTDKFDRSIRVEKKNNFSKLS